MAFWTTLLIIHGLLAVALLGAITHQAVSVWMPVRSKAGNFVTRFRAVPSTSYVMAIIVLYVVTFVMGAWIGWPSGSASRSRFAKSLASPPSARLTCRSALGRSCARRRTAPGKKLRGAPRERGRKPNPYRRRGHGRKQG